MAVWQCRLLLGVVLTHLALGSPAVRRDLLALTHDSDPAANPLAQLRPETLGEDTFGGPTPERRAGREKRLLKTIGVGALGVKAAKAVGAKVVAAGAKAVGAKVLKAGAVVKAVATGAVGLKAKTIGVKAVTAVAALGIKALLFKLLFGKINQLITHKEKLLNQLDQFNKVQNEKFSHQLFGAPCNHKPQGGPQTYGPPTVAPAYTPANFSPEPLPYSPEPLPYSPEPLPNYSPDVLPSQLSKTSLQPRRQNTTPSPTTDNSDGEIPEFDPNKISLQVPDELFAPAFNSVNSISTVVGNLIQNTAERVARLVERMKPILRSSLGFQSRKRQTNDDSKENLTTNEGENEKDELAGETSYFTDSGLPGPAEIQQTAGSETKTTTADESSLHSSIKTSYTALVDNN